MTNDHADRWCKDQTYIEHAMREDEACAIGCNNDPEKDEYANGPESRVRHPPRENRNKDHEQACSKDVRD